MDLLVLIKVVLQSRFFQKSLLGMKTIMRKDAISLDIENQVVS